MNSTKGKVETVAPARDVAKDENSRLSSPVFG
jgi:hypothetical protein